MRIAILGGSFNPIHVGHLVLAEEVRVKLGYDKILFIPVNLPPHKELANGATVEDRLNMLELAIQGNPFFEVSECEIKRGGVSYTYDTVLEMQAKFSDVLESKIGVIMGDDLVDGFHLWHNSLELSKQADLILARRVVCENINIPVFSYRHIELENGVLPISSSQIRANISEKIGGWRYLVPDAVYKYIVKRNLYGCSTN